MNIIRDGAVMMAIHCNKGTSHTILVGDVQLLQQDVIWFHSKGVANLLSFYQFIQHYPVTYESHTSNTFLLKTPNGKVIKFKQYPRGMYCHDTPDEYDQDMLTTAGQ